MYAREIYTIWDYFVFVVAILAVIFTVWIGLSIARDRAGAECYQYRQQYDMEFRVRGPTRQVHTEDGWFPANKILKLEER